MQPAFIYSKIEFDITMKNALDITIKIKPIWSPDKPLPTLPVLRKMVACFEAPWETPDLSKLVRIGYNPKLRTTIGRAALHAFRVELNPRLLIAHPQELIPTLGHELAHLVAHRKFGKVEPHGLEFQALMHAVGLDSRATHDLPVAHLRQKRKRFIYIHKCSDCGLTFAARSAKRNHYCAKCGPAMTWDIFKIPNTEAGQQIANQILNAN